MKQQIRDNLNKTDCTVYRCTQCGEVVYKPFAHNEMLSCGCEKKMPWEWIYTKEWIEFYRKQRIELGIPLPD